MPDLPRELDPKEGTRFPLLDELRRLDHINRTDHARQVICIGALTHADADERRTAEFILRNRHRAADRARGARWLIARARCAAEMDVRRARRREVPADDLMLVTLAPEPVTPAVTEASVSDLVIWFLARTTRRPISTSTRAVLSDAVVTFSELAERHALNNGTAPALIAMRSAARKEARLVTHLQDSLQNPRLARRLSRLLIGADGTEMDTAALWWATRAREDDLWVPAELSRRWRRDLAALEQMVQSASPSLAA